MLKSRTGALLLGASEASGRVHLNPAFATFAQVAARPANRAAGAGVPCDEPGDPAALERADASVIRDRAIVHIFVLIDSKQKAIWSIDELFRPDIEVNDAVAAAVKERRERLAATLLSSSSAPGTSSPYKAGRHVDSLARLPSVVLERDPWLGVGGGFGGGGQIAATALCRHHSVFLCCPTPRTMLMASLLLAKLWRLWPRVRVIILHGGGTANEAKLVAELTKTLRDEGLMKNGQVLGGMTEASVADEAVQYEREVLLGSADARASRDNPMRARDEARCWTLTRHDPHTGLGHDSFFLRDTHNVAKTPAAEQEGGDGPEDGRQSEWGQKASFEEAAFHRARSGRVRKTSESSTTPAATKASSRASSSSCTTATRPS